MDIAFSTLLCQTGCVRERFPWRRQVAVLLICRLWEDKLRGGEFNIHASLQTSLLDNDRPGIEPKTPCTFCENFVPALIFHVMHHYHIYCVCII